MDSLLSSLSNYAPPTGGDLWWGLLCILPLLYGAWRGWRNGLVKEVISFVGIFLGFSIAYHYYKQTDVGVLGFLLIWVGIPIVLGVVAWLITKMLDKMGVIGTTNKLLGAAAGFLKFAFLLGCLIMAVDYVREVKHKVEENPVVKMLEAVPNALFPGVRPVGDAFVSPINYVEDGREKGQ